MPETHPCPTCGHVHHAPPAVDWTGYEEAVTELASAWLAEQDHLLGCWRASEISTDNGASERRRLAEGKVETYLRAYFEYGFIIVHPLLGRIEWYRSGQPDVAIFTVTHGPIRPDGAA